MEVAFEPYTPAQETEPELIARFVVFLNVQSENRVFVLRKELTACLRQEDSLWTCEVESLYLMGYGYSAEQAISRFQDDFAATYDGLINEPDDQLTKDARQLRDAIKALVSKEYSLMNWADDLPSIQTTLPVGTTL